ETVAGLVADLLGRIPAPGDRAELPGWRLSVRHRHRSPCVFGGRILPLRHRSGLFGEVRHGVPEAP
ncbi:transporter associated domain-containing protein, partial [Streptomyces sp. NPDC051132]|uniref:transporter associated domain-containing protein n=1 Tax=Streptomyces sp. NPDC051132 TaxID=3155667 RepID=UPI0034308F41